MSARDRRIAARLTAWFGANRRDLPWRTEERDPWATLVSETMLQQTQVSRVAERFEAFMARFPTARALAEAPLDDLLSLWQGLGYYRRARSLHEAARQIVARHGGEVPGEREALVELMGVGPYTAGAVASMAFGRREALVDGNVARVLLRVEGRRMRAGEAETVRWAWARARALVERAEDPGALNEALMELGATVCTPRGARCGDCPLSRVCVAKREGAQGEIPGAKRRAARRVLHHACLVATDEKGRVALERRGGGSLWSGLWAPPAVERGDRAARKAEVAAALGLSVPPARCARFTHQTTHREVRVAVWVGAAAEKRDWRWVSARELEGVGLSSAHRRVFEAAGVLGRE